MLPRALKPGELEFREKPSKWPVVKRLVQGTKRAKKKRSSKIHLRSMKQKLELM
jgi:hypothetical protein